jgi:hypothetical protein
MRRLCRSSYRLLADIRSGVLSFHAANPLQTFEVRPSKHQGKSTSRRQVHPSRTRLNYPEQAASIRAACDYSGPEAAREYRCAMAISTALHSFYLGLLRLRPPASGMSRLLTYVTNRLCDGEILVRFLTKAFSPGHVLNSRTCGQLKTMEYEEP